MIITNQDERRLALCQWLSQNSLITEPNLHLLAGDASFRRYFRVSHAGKSYIAMDAPPEKENCVPFVAIANALRAHGLLTPEIIAQNTAAGFLLLTDFGDRLLLNELTSANAHQLYGQALTTLSRLQSCTQVDGWKIPPFTADFMYKELKLFQEWYLQKYLNITLSVSMVDMLDKFFLFLAETAASQPQVFMHRDYHSANLMVLANDQIGILDFQDAFIGPVTYDSVSLLRDCYIAWPESQVQKLALQYRDLLKLTVSDDEFIRWFDLIALQRHLKALLTFSRKYCRDGSANYLKHIPRTLNYILQESKPYVECQEFTNFLHNVILPAQQEVKSVCVE